MTTSRDGLLKILHLEEAEPVLKYSSKRSFFVCENGVSCSSLLNDNSLALGTFDNQILLFSFSTGTNVLSFTAHDNCLSSLVVAKDTLFSASHDTTVKVWDLRKRNFGDSPEIFYDHEDMVLSLDVNENYVASLDVLGTLLLRDVRKPSDILRTIEVTDDREEITGSSRVCFNKKDGEEVFVSWNNRMGLFNALTGEE